MDHRTAAARIGLLAVGASALLTSAAGAAEQAPTTITADYECTSVAVASSRYDLSNVVLRFADGDQKFEGLRGRTGSFAGTGAFAGDPIQTVFVKAGNNGSDAGPGYGQEVAPADGNGCASTPATTDATTEKTADEPRHDPSDKPTDQPAGQPVSRPSEKPAASQGATAVVGATFDCVADAVTVTSTKNLSNVVLVLADGTEDKHDGLSGRQRTFTADQRIVAVYVKSGANASGDGPGYGQRVDNTTTCGAPGGGTAPGETSGATVGNTTGNTTGGTPGTTGVSSPAVDARTTTAGADVLGLTVLPAGVAAPEAAVTVDAAGAKPARATRVLGASLERGGASAALARTGLEIGGLVAVAGLLLGLGLLLVRRGRRTA